MRRERGSMPEVCQSHVKTRTLMPRLVQIRELRRAAGCCRAPG